MLPKISLQFSVLSPPNQLEIRNQRSGLDFKHDREPKAPVVVGVAAINVSNAQGPAVARVADKEAVTAILLTSRLLKQTGVMLWVDLRIDKKRQSFVPYVFLYFFQHFSEIQNFSSHFLNTFFGDLVSKRFLETWSPKTSGLQKP
jgi:hypothetical protein